MKVEVNNDRKGGEAMKFASKYISPIFITLFWFLLGGAFILFFDLAVGLVYESLSIWNHDLFPTPSPISEVEAYRALQSALTIVTIIFTVITSTSFAKRFDNKRFEYLIVQTEGFYTVPERTVLYFKEFWLSDVIASSISPILLILPVYLVPEEYLAPFYPVFWCGARMLPYFGLFEALIYVILISILSRFILIPPTLTAWRANWLTGSIE